MRGPITGNFVVLAAFLCLSGLVSCGSAVTPREYMRFVRDEANGHTRTFTSPSGISWKVTVAPKEYMALAALRTDRPGAEDFRTAVGEHADLTYLIVRTPDRALSVPYPCEAAFAASCEDAEPSGASMCQEMASVDAEREFLLAFPAAAGDCGTSLCIYYSPSGMAGREKIGCFEKSEMKELPTVKLY